MNAKRIKDFLIDNLSWIISDKSYLKWKFRKNMRYSLDLDNPKTFAEKIQWLKLYEREPFYTKLVDKYEVKQYIAEKLGNNFVIPTLGVWDSIKDIDWDILPEQFVLKTTHGGGSKGVIICKDKSHFDKKAAIKCLKESFKIDLYVHSKEWPYKNIKKRIIAEPFMVDYDNQGVPVSTDLSDYKFYCFNGEPLYCQVIRNRSTTETIDFYDAQWNHMPFVGLNPECKNGALPVMKPALLTDMLNICHQLAHGFAFLRVDLYIINNKIYFGEITFFPNSGEGTFTPSEWNEKLGALITLPQK